MKSLLNYRSYLCELLKYLVTSTEMREIKCLKVAMQNIHQRLHSCATSISQDDHHGFKFKF